MFVEILLVTILLVLLYLVIFVRNSLNVINDSLYNDALVLKKLLVKIDDQLYDIDKKIKDE